MAYCRWSSDNFKCDLYVFEVVGGGYQVHIAGTRVVGEVPPLMWPRLEPGELIEDDDFYLLEQSYKAQGDFLETAERVPIGLPWDNTSFWFQELGELRMFLNAAKTIGYQFPDEIFDIIEEEMADNEVEILPLPSLQIWEALKVVASKDAHPEVFA